GYLPANVERRESTLQRKRQEYFGFIEQYYESRNEEHHQDTYRQIHIDIPRTNPLIPLFQQASVQEVWGIRHPLHDSHVRILSFGPGSCLHRRPQSVTTFCILSTVAGSFAPGLVSTSPSSVGDHPSIWFWLLGPLPLEEEVENFDVSSLPEEVLRNIEADSFWCMSKLLDGIQDNYTFAQPGIQRKVKALEELVSRIDEHVHRYIQQYEVEYLQFAFRWMNNLLMRELPLRCTIRLWDTYQVSNCPRNHT
ncbi:TB22B protein, partial [Polyodon spathula]|nr:TB22B protein [Polyodon spathula]